MIFYNFSTNNIQVGNKPETPPRLRTAANYYTNYLFKDRNSKFKRKFSPYFKYINQFKYWSEEKISSAKNKVTLSQKVTRREVEKPIKPKSRFRISLSFSKNRLKRIAQIYKRDQKQ